MDRNSPRERLPLCALLALATAVFVTSLTETLPAGLLPQMSATLGTTESATGQTVTVYAVGTALTTIPLTAVTVRWRRKLLLQISILGFLAANSVTAASASFQLTMAARFVAGMAAGVTWALLAGYARRLVPERLHGRAIAVAMAGIPLALALGVPVGTFVGTETGWRTAFWGMSVLAAALMAWVAVLVPDFPGAPPGTDSSFRKCFRVPGVSAVLFVTGATVLAHTIFYTYLAAFLDDLGFGADVDVALLAFGVSCLVSIWIVGLVIDRKLRTLATSSAALFAVALTLLGIGGESPFALYAALVLWGLAWGGAPTVLQTAIGRAGGDVADEAQAVLVTLWNVAMAAGGVVGGLLLGGLGSGSLPWAALIVSVPSIACIVRFFPAGASKTKAVQATPA